LEEYLRCIGAPLKMERGWINTLDRLTTCYVCDFQMRDVLYLPETMIDGYVCSFFHKDMLWESHERFCDVSHSPFKNIQDDVMYTNRPRQALRF
jgi:hypothetical protein